MQLNIGDVSGCLEIIDICSNIQDEINEIKDIYKKEDPKYYDSYVKYDNRFLYHKQKPNTSYELIQNFRDGKLYKVRCNICEHTYYIDEASFSCVKWKHCSYKECNCQACKNTGSVDYSQNLYKFNETSITIKNTALEKAKNLSLNFSVYGGHRKLKIAYISDIHLESHIDENRSLYQIAKMLTDSLESKSVDLIFFGGDTANNSDLCIQFYKIFVENIDRYYRSKIYVILGNHEFLGFMSSKHSMDSDKCITFYKESLLQIGIHLLHNTSNVDVNNRCIIYGGTGFGKYNKIGLDCWPGIDVEKETNLFEVGYYNALNYAQDNHLCLFCIAHYPIEDCLNDKYSPVSIYFTGHTHRNLLNIDSTKTIYADNQIGYYTHNISFKFAQTGTEINPYITLQDGLYETTLGDYLQFYRYIGEYIGEGRLLSQRLNSKSKMYVIKYSGYYGFFIVNCNGIQIVYGGQTRRITDLTDINYICDCFCNVLTNYMQLLLPLRTFQQHLSDELKNLGLDGTIHGCIVDIDYYHHIMINPYDGEVTFYYSPVWGNVQKLSTFENVIESMKTVSGYMSIDYNKLYMGYIAQKDNSLLAKVSNPKLLEIENLKNEIQQVDRSGGMYYLSRRMNALQKLFDNRVLCDFDFDLANLKLSKK